MSEQIKELPCLCCGTAVEWDAQGSGRFRSITSSNWGSAGTIEISCGWGSRFDMATYHAVICDDCIEARKDRVRQVKLTSHEAPKVLYGTELEPEFFNQLAIPTADAKFTAARREEQMEKARREFLESIRPDSAD